MLNINFVISGNRKKYIFFVRNLLGFYSSKSFAQPFSVWKSQHKFKCIGNRNLAGLVYFYKQPQITVIVVNVVSNVYIQILILQSIRNRYFKDQFIMAEIAYRPQMAMCDLVVDTTGAALWTSSEIAAILVDD